LPFATSTVTMSINAPFQIANDRRCYVVYLGEDGGDAPVELHGTEREVKREVRHSLP
jgi:hypothetical protein